MSEGHTTRHILIWVGHFEPGYRAGGPIRSVAHIVDNAAADVEVMLVTRDHDLGSDAPFPGLSGTWIDRGRHRVFYLNTRSARQWRGLARAVRQQPFDTVYVNSFWSPLFALLPVAATRLGVIKTAHVLVAPRGELSAGARSLKGGKKRIAMPVWRLMFSHPTVRWHATSDSEVREITSLFPAARVRFVPGQATLPREPLAPANPHLGPLRLIFLSRISPKKNLLGLLKACAGIDGHLSLDIYGPIGDADYWSSCQEVIATLPASVRVAYRGDLPHDHVLRAFSDHDVFCLPTLGENFGHVIAESLAASCPVVCTDRTPWTALLHDGGGAVMPSPEVADIVATVQEWVNFSPEQRHARRLAAGQAFMRWQRERTESSVLGPERPEAGESVPGGTRRIALVTQGFRTGGGVPQVARWMRDGLRAMDGYEVDLHDVATSRTDAYSRRLMAPWTWGRRSLRHSSVVEDVTYWGANGVELEFMRYRPRRELTKVLDGYDVVQIISGGPALGRLAERVSTPVVLETATRVSWERASQLARTPRQLRLWRTAMTRLTERAERRALARADAVLVPNRQLADDVRRHTCAPVHLIPHGIDTQRFHTRPGGLPSRGHVLTVCRLGDPRKALERVVEAYGLLLQRDPGAPDLVLAGKGRLSPVARDAIARLSLTDRITVLTDVPAEQLPELYRGASVFVQASQEEGFGISVAEAMASALPVVCTDTAGTRETVVEGETGWVVPQDPHVVVERPADPLAAALGPEGPVRGMAGMARCRQLFSEDVTITQVTTLYERLLGGRDRVFTTA